MFYYISFIRPPPTQGGTSGPISITPQIANDLRTEPYKLSQDIYYSWVPYPRTHSSTTSSPNLQTTKPAKLTTYRHSSTYKEIPVPSPPHVREGQQWQLILSCSAQSTLLKPNYTIDLNESTIGDTPLPVISAPLLFSARGLRGNTRKQERVERVYRFSNPMSTPHQPTQSVIGEPAGQMAQTYELKITEQTSFDLDKKIWDSGIGLSSWLVEFQNVQRNQRSQSQEALWQALFSHERRNMVELGAGTGIVSLIIASLRDQLNESENKDDGIIATDLESALPLLNYNIISNRSLYPHNVPKVEVLDWEDEFLPESVNLLRRIDVIVMSDVTYNTSSFPSLVQTIAKLIKKENPPVILLGYKERDTAERDLWALLRAMGLHLEKIGERRGAAEPAVEIWFGYLAGSPSWDPSKG